MVGFCFSFPLKQASVNHGTLIKWNKGFTNANAVGEDPTELLEAALARQGMQVSSALAVAWLHAHLQAQYPVCWLFLPEWEGPSRGPAGSCALSALGVQLASATLL